MFLQQKYRRCSHVEIARYYSRPSNVTLWDLCEFKARTRQQQQHQKNSRMQIGIYIWHDMCIHISFMMRERCLNAAIDLLTSFIVFSHLLHQRMPFPYHAPIHAIQLEAFRGTHTHAKKERNFMPPRHCLAWF